MSAVETWKARQVLVGVAASPASRKWPIVRIEENLAPSVGQPPCNNGLSTGVHRKSESFTRVLHSLFAAEKLLALGRAARRADSAVAALGRFCRGRKVCGRGGTLLQSVHQSRDRAVQVFV